MKWSSSRTAGSCNALSIARGRVQGYCPRELRPGKAKREKIKTGGNGNDGEDKGAAETEPATL
jgi:hypothetical protein